MNQNHKEGQKEEKQEQAVRKKNHSHNRNERHRNNNDHAHEQKKDMRARHPKPEGKPQEKPVPKKEGLPFEHKEHHNENREHKKPAVEHKSEGRTYKYIAFVSFKDSKKVYTFGTDFDVYRVGDDVVVETIRGLELGKIVKESEAFLSNGMEIKPIIRKATEHDLQQAKHNVEKAKKAMEICAECIANLGLEMNLIEAEYTLDCSKVIFIYVADERVDFRELLKDLASIFKCRIELRQIGPRNKAKIIGGLGSCGMETCCSRFLNDFDVVSINMAKNQLLALNIQKLSGQCGKLMCCLKYEDGQYKKLREGLPKMNSQIEYKGSRYRITSMNVLLQQVKIENKEDVQFLSFQELWPDIDFSDR